jgi:hypothetical protein
MASNKDLMVNLHSVLPFEFIDRKEGATSPLIAERIMHDARVNSMFNTDYAYFEERTVSALLADAARVQDPSANVLNMLEQVMNTVPPRERVLRAGRNPYQEFPFVAQKKPVAVDYSKAKRRIRVRRG